MAEVHSLEGNESLFFLRFSDFKLIGEYPKFSSNIQNVINFNEIDIQSSFLIFVSQNWLQVENFLSVNDLHPDNPFNQQYQLCVEGIEKLLSLTNKISDQDCYLWIDFCCMHVIFDPSSNKSPPPLENLIKVCDCIFSPIVDYDNSNDYHDEIQSESGAASSNDDIWLYQSLLWQSRGAHAYIHSSWCRLEIIYNSIFPWSPIHPTKVNSLQGSSFDKFIDSAKRPHIIYTTEVSNAQQLPIFLPSISTNILVSHYHPSLGKATIESDRAIISGLLEKVNLSTTSSPIEDHNYEGEYLHGKMNGFGKYTYNNGNIYIGQWENNLKHGMGKCLFHSGNIYEGGYKNDKKHGDGKFTYVNGNEYEGQWEDGKMHGVGIYRYSNGNIYEGDWRAGKKEGFGKLIYSNNNIYEGHWMNGKKHGKGSLLFASGDIYVGNFKNDTMSGFGNYTYINGDHYAGEWQDGKINGKGKYTYSDGNVYEGDWVNDVMNGYGICHYANGAYYEGEWKMGLKSGRGKQVTMKGVVREGFWINDEYQPEKNCICRRESCCIT